MINISNLVYCTILKGKFIPKVTRKLFMQNNTRAADADSAYSNRWEQDVMTSLLIGSGISA